MNITYPRQVCQAIKNNFSIYRTPVYYQMYYIDNKHLQNGKSYVILKLYKLDRITGIFKTKVSIYNTSSASNFITSQYIDVT